MKSMLLGVFQELQALNAELKIRAMNETPGTPTFCVTEEEWIRVLHLVIKCDLPAYLFQESYGFAFGVYGRSVSDGGSPELLLRVNAAQLPLFLKAHSPDGQYDERATLLRLFEFVHNEVNRTLIEFYGLKPLSNDLSYYAYA